MVKQSIFSALAKYNSATDENYLTEAFVFLINSLLTRERAVGLEVLNHLCVQNNDFCFGMDEAISVSTQDVTEQGTPDIKISSPDKLIYIEVKHDSPLGYQQLERYKKALVSSTATFKQVVLLTRFAIDFAEQAERPYKHIRWREVHDLLENTKDKIKDKVSGYLSAQFVSFLEAKGMSIQQVGSEYIKGIPALNNMMSMIEKAIEESGMHFYKSYPRAAGWGFKGFWMEDKQFWCGIYYHNPLVVTFQLVDKRKFNKELIGTTDYKLKEGNVRLWFRLPLEEINFFSLDKDKQLEEITKFVKTAYAEAQQMMVK